MNLNKEMWKREDVKLFQKYLKSFSKGKSKGEWEQRIVNTKLPCIAVPSPIVNKIISEIAKGNFMSFLNLNICETLTNTFINGGLICRIKDYETMEKHLIEYAQKADNWATIDTLKFKFTEENKDKYILLSKKLSTCPHSFCRRLSLVILLKLCGDEKLLDTIFEVSRKFKKEQEYYVNMANAWLIAECFIKHRERTLEFIKRGELNKFTINKAISKCRDSYRVSKQDKEMLLTFKEN